MTSPTNGVRFASIKGTAAAVPLESLKATQPWRLAVVVKNLVNPAYRSALKAGDDAGARYGVSVTGVAPKVPDDLREQSELIASLLDEKRVDGIVFTPVDPVAQIAIFERANRLGIGLFNFSNLVGGGEIVTFVGSDDTDIGRRMVDWLAKDSGGKARVAIIEGIAHAATAEQRLAGVHEALAKHPGLEVVASQSGNYDRRLASNVTADILAAHPDVDAILALNDEMALGAVIALEAVNRYQGVRVVGVNGTPDGLTAVKTGKLAATVDYALYAMTMRSVELAVRYLNGERLDEQNVMLPTPVIDRTNIDDAIAERHSWGLM